MNILSTKVFVSGYAIKWVMKRRHFFSRIWDLYSDGFKTMGPLGKKLWLLIGIKLAIMFLVLKLLFFPNYLKKNFDTEADRSKHVIENLTKTQNN